MIYFKGVFFLCKQKDTSILDLKPILPFRQVTHPYIKTFTSLWSYATAHDRWQVNPCKRHAKVLTTSDNISEDVCWRLIKENYRKRRGKWLLLFLQENRTYKKKTKKNFSRWWREYIYSALKQGGANSQLELKKTKFYANIPLFKKISR